LSTGAGSFRRSLDSARCGFQFFNGKTHIAQVITVLPVAHSQRATVLRLVLKQVEELRYQWIADTGKFLSEVIPRDRARLQSASLSGSPELEIA